MTGPGPLPLAGATLGDLTALFERLGEPAYRARQLYRQIYVRGVADTERMTDLSKGLRGALAPHVTPGVPEVVDVRASADGTRKLLYGLADGKQVEGVLIPLGPPGDRRAHRLTLCISTQVGCTLDCTFCLTASMGLQRNLTAGEIVGQVLAARALVGEDEQLGRLVFMGMGEPLANYAAVVDAVNLMGDPGGMSLSGRRITVSTAGLAGRIPDFGRDTRAMLAVSLNGTTDEQRARLMPRVHRAASLGELMEACRRFPMESRRRLTFEYVLLADENDTEEDAHRLAGLVRAQRAKVNLIPYNPHPASEFRRPAPARVARFQAVLLAADVATSVRQARGDDVLAACGQLGVPGARPLAGGPGLQ